MVIGAGTTVTVENCAIDTLNAAAISGAGAIAYGGLTFASSSAITVTTQSILNEGPSKTISSTNSGNTNTLTVSNASNTATSQALINVLVAGTTAGDAFQTYTVAGTTNWSTGVDNSVTGDPFVIAASTALGTTNIMSALTSGEINYPLLPAFSANKSSNTNNVTGNSVTYQFICNNEIFDQGSDYDGSTGTFTAPVTGRYYLSVNAGLTGCTICTGSQIILGTSNRNVFFSDFRPATSADQNCSGTYLCDMDAADTCITSIIGYGEAATTDDMIGNAAFQTCFSGFLAC
jgi:hypothetical protein